MRQQFSLNKQSPILTIHSQWPVKTLVISNPTTNSVLVAVGRTDAPTLDSADYILPGGTLNQVPVTGADFALTLTSPGTLPAVGNTVQVSILSAEEPVGSIGAFAIGITGGHVGQTVYVASGVSSTVTTSSASYVDMPDMVITLNTTGGDLLVDMVACVYNSNVFMGISLDGGAEVGESFDSQPTAGEYQSCPRTAAFTGVAPGAHTIKGRYHTNVVGTVTLYSTYRQLRVRET